MTNANEMNAPARAEQFHAVLVDLRMPHVDGLEVVATLKAEQPELPMVVVSGTGVLSDTVEAMHLRSCRLIWILSSKAGTRWPTSLMSYFC
jgi:DNA-binding NtrC family response regulator